MNSDHIKNKPHVSGTYHLLPFELLSSDSFERMCLWLIEREGFENVEHIGDAGSDSGCDIRASKNANLWIFQCKNVREFGPSDVVQEMEKFATLNLPQPVTVVFLVACRVSLRTREVGGSYGYRDAYDIRFWGRTELDEKIKRYPDIVEEFFQITSAVHTEEKVAVALITYLEDKRIIFDFRVDYSLVAHRMADYQEIQESVQNIRRRLTIDMESLERGTTLFHILSKMRTACHKYLNASPKELSVLNILLRGSEALRNGKIPTPEAFTWSDFLKVVHDQYRELEHQEAESFNNAIRAFRRSFVSQILSICDTFGIQLSIEHQQYVENMCLTDNF